MEDERAGLFRILRLMGPNKVLVSRGEARKKGYPYFNRCRPCKSCGGTIRYVTNYHCYFCRDEIRETERKKRNQRYAKDEEFRKRHIAHVRKWQAKNPEKVRKYIKKHRDR